jgi:hypothetical protein
MANNRVFAQHNRRTMERYWKRGGWEHQRAHWQAAESPPRPDPTAPELWRNLALPDDVVYYYHRWGFGAAGKVIDYLRERARETVNGDEKRRQLEMMVRIVDSQDRRRFTVITEMLTDASGDVDPRHGSVEGQVY